MATRWRLCVCSLGILLLASCTLSEKFSLSGSSRPVVGVVGQDVVLPCQLSPAAQLPRMDLWWRKIGTGFIPVHEYLDEGPSEQPGEGYQNRTELFRQEFSNGNVSLKLKRLRVADGGTYHCFVRNPEWSQEATTELQVAAVAPVFIGILGPRGQGLGLVCRSTGWFPKPKLQWVGKNQLNQAMESVTNMTQDRENLYSVVSHVTVTEEDSGDISCIVRNGLLETEQQSVIHLSSDAFPQVSPWLAAFWALFTLVLVAAGVCAYVGYTGKRKASEKKRSEHEALLKTEKEKKDLLSEYSELRNVLESKRQDNEKLTTELQELSQKLESKENEIQQLQSESQKLNRTVESQENEIKQLKSERQELSLKLVSHGNEIKRLQSEHDKLNWTVESQENEIKQLKSECLSQSQRLEVKTKDFESECQELCQRLEVKTKDFESECQELHQKLESQKKANEQLTKESEKKQSDWNSETETAQIKKRSLQSGLRRAQSYPAPE